jgi:hypothetical protein
MTDAPHLWANLAAEGIVRGAQPPADEARAPWYVRAMLGVAGWIAAAFLFGFVGSAFPWVIDSRTASLAVGLASIVAAYAMLRMRRGREFVEQFALATSLAGQALAGLGLFVLLEPHEAQAWVVLAAAQSALVMLMRSYVHRVWSAYAAGVCVALALAEVGGMAFAAGVLSAGVAVLWLREIEWIAFAAWLRPASYGLTLALVQVQGELTFADGALGLISGARHTMSWLDLWAGEVLSGIVLVAVVLLTVARGGRLGRPQGRAALGGALVAALLSLQAPGLAAGTMLVILGFAAGNRLLTGLAIAALLFYVGAYYYNLQATLLAKSGVLAATGLAMLGARWALLCWRGAAEERSHA